MEACLVAGEFESVAHYADMLEAFTHAERLPWSDFFIARGRALSRAAEAPEDGSLRDQLQALIETTKRVGMGTALPALAGALEAA